MKEHDRKWSTCVNTMGAGQSSGLHDESTLGGAGSGVQWGARQWAARQWQRGSVGSETVAARFSGSEVQWGGRFGEVVGRVWGARQAGAGAHAGSGGRGPGGTEGARVAGTPAIRGGRGGLKEAPGGWRVEECTERGGGVLGVRGAGGR